MPFDNLLTEREGPVVVVTINRPKVLNALNAATFSELRQVTAEIRNDPGVRAVVLTGAGDRSFVAGADISELTALTAAAAHELAVSGQQTFTALEQLGKPVIAAVNGFALGGGCELAMACTMRLAAENAKFGQPEINLGLLPGYAGTQRLPRLVGRGRALELLLTGAPISAQEAWRIGLVNRVVPAAELLTEARLLAAELAARAPLAVRYILDAVDTGLDLPLAAASAHEASLFGLAAASGDMREGTQAFLEKRKPTFEGR